MKLDLRFTNDNCGDIVYINTDDNFYLNGEIIDVTDTSIAVRDIKSHAIFTIFLFEIKELIIIENNKNKSFHNFIEVPKAAVGPGSLVKTKVDADTLNVDYYEHPIFGKLSRDEIVLDYCELKRPKYSVDINVCQYLAVSTNDDSYKESVAHLCKCLTIGVSFYESCQPEHYRYLVLSCPSFSLLIDLLSLEADQIHCRYGELVELMSDEKLLKVVYGGPNLFLFVHTHLGTPINNFIDLEMLHYGLHNIRATEPLKNTLSYTDIVRLLFNVTFNIQGQDYFTRDDVLHKLAFNTHFLIPIYQLMFNRLLEPVKNISRRLCRMNIEEIESDTVLTDLNVSLSSCHNLAILPRSLHFWSYSDTSLILCSKKQIDTELNNEKEEDGGDRHNVVEMNKKHIQRQDEYFKESCESIDKEIEAYEEVNSLWRREQPLVAARIGVGRGRGLLTRVDNGVLRDNVAREKKREEYVGGEYKKKLSEEIEIIGSGSSDTRIEMNGSGASDRVMEITGRGVSDKEINIVGSGASGKEMNIKYCAEELKEDMSVNIVRCYPTRLRKYDWFNYKKENISVPRDISNECKEVKGSVQSIHESNVSKTDEVLDEGCTDINDILCSSRDCIGEVNVQNDKEYVRCYPIRLRLMPSKKLDGGTTNKGVYMNEIIENVNEDKYPLDHVKEECNTICNEGMINANVDIIMKTNVIKLECNEWNDSHARVDKSNIIKKVCYPIRLRNLLSKEGRKDNYNGRSIDEGELHDMVAAKIDHRDNVIEPNIPQFNEGCEEKIIDRRIVDMGSRESIKNINRDCSVEVIGEPSTTQKDGMNEGRMKIPDARAKNIRNGHDEGGAVAQEVDENNNEEVNECCYPIRMSGPYQEKRLGGTKNGEPRLSLLQVNVNYDAIDHGGRTCGLGRGVSPLFNVRPSINGYEESMVVSGHASNSMSSTSCIMGSTMSNIENMDLDPHCNEETRLEPDFCELPQRTWIKNRMGKLSLDKYNELRVRATTKNEAQGILWNACGIQTDKIIDDLYRDFGLDNYNL